MFCDSCDQAYHMSCHRPAILRTPRGRWECEWRQWNASSKACEYSLWLATQRKRARPEIAPTVLYGGFAPGAAELRAFARDRCVWLTVFREPLARLVSSLHYCRHKRFDPLCASADLEPRNATLREWAARHTNATMGRWRMIDRFLVRGEAA